MKKEIERKINNNYSTNNYSINYEPKRGNRWIVEIPEIKIEPYLFQSISVPAIVREKSNWTSYKTPSIKPVTISLIETVHTNHYGTFIEFLRDYKNLTVWIKYLNSTGTEISKVLLEKCKVLEVSQSELSNEKDDILNTFVLIKPTGVKFPK